MSSCGTNQAVPSPTAPTIPIQQAPAPRLPIADSVLANATLRGMVYEVVTGSRVGIDGVSVYCEQCGESTHNFAYTDAAGSYVFPCGVWTEGRPAFPIRIWITKDGYKDPDGLPKPTPPNPSGPGWREVVIDGDTRFDAELVRR